MDRYHVPSAKVVDGVVGSEAEVANGESVSSGGPDELR
jgi:hypothetical protein